MLKKRNIVLALMLVVSVLMIFGQTVSAAEPKKGGTLTFGDWPVLGLDPHIESVMASGVCLSNIFSTLLNYDEQGKIVPELAKSWEMSSDGKVYTIKLHDNVYFHNGRKMTSADVKYSFERILNPETGSMQIDTLLDIDKIETPDDNTVKFTLKQPLAPFLAYLANPYAAVVAKENVEDGSITKHPIGTGPFMFKEWVSGDHILMVKNPKYYKPGLPYLDVVKYKQITEDSAWLAALRTKKMDVTYHYEGAFMRNIRKLKGLQLKKWQQLGYGGLFFNFTVPPFDNPKVRLAISYAIDRQEVLDTGFLGEGSLTAPLPESLGYAVPLKELTGYKQDYEKAKALLKEAGHADGLKMKLLTAGDFPYYLSVCQVIQDQLKNIGIEVEIVTMEWGAFIGQLFSGEGFDTYFLDIAPFPMDPDIYALRMVYSQGIYNVGKFSDPEVDSLIDKGRTTIDQAGRKKIYSDLQHRLADTVACVYLFRTQFTWIMQPYVKGNVGNALTANLEYIWFDK